MNLREIRKQNNMTMRELGDKLNISESAISQYEKEKREPDIKTLIKIADIFNVSVDLLIGRNQETSNDYKILFNRTNFKNCIRLYDNSGDVTEFVFDRHKFEDIKAICERITKL